MIKKTLFYLLFMLIGIFSAYSQIDSTAVDDNIQKVHHNRRTGTDVVATPDTNSLDKLPTTISDSSMKRKHSPALAATLSIIPGGGQIYNHRWWKIPIIYALLGTSSYYIYHFAVKSNWYKNEYINRMNGNIELLDPKLSLVPDANLIAGKNKNLRNMEIAIAATTIIYLLNIIDATVDAHLFFFDISDDLSLNVSPLFYNNFNLCSYNSGFSLTLNF